MGAASHVQQVEPPVGLSARDQEILDFENRHWTYAGSKEQGIKDLFSLSSTRYYQLLNQLIDSEAALAYKPLLIKRLRRDRSRRQRARSMRRLGMQS
ncbi:DUF3263 domain-containing protein [uncultured Serinicoccus sp.]|uniref:DUF3263 domain-containing protein n=1 Tax=uncultured Serinicoccus sp. TaxID=735514 RepID=UPI0026319E60|nr:DUF3263 domain-containing protein [uncultured Serinicoccus sp.]